MTCGDWLAGPMVHTIFVRRFGMVMVPRIFR